MSINNDLVLVYVTTPNMKEAKSIAKKIIDLKLAACCNIYENITSIYRWEGEVQEDNECSIFLKTKKDLFEELKENIIKMHSYDNPCVVMLPILEGSELFMKWVNNEVKSR
ncbi:MAG: divalent-cation tolerance protein CutA [Candidatus Omnitrophica bacterium]|nr:divalent-cation tolerance protein CutA [Candidatus Omnitrophota bacterium]